MKDCDREEQQQERRQIDCVVVDAMGEVYDGAGEQQYE